MWKKATVLFGVSALLMGGCNARTDVPPVGETPMQDVEQDTHDVERDANDSMDQLGEDVREGAQDIVPGTNDDNRVEPITEDKNLNEDKDMMKDTNTKEEEILEDDMDRRDADNKDE